MKSSHYLSILQEILASNSLDRLEEFKEPALWTQMTSDERELLAMLFTLQGERTLVSNDQKALEIFILALRIAPSNAQIFYRQGLAWFTYAKRQHQERCLSLASQNMQKATSFNPAFVDAWCCWANILVEMGKAYGDLTYFQEADEKFSHAYELLHNNSEAQAALCWDWAVCWASMGKHSGEAIDYRTAVEKFEEAHNLGCDGSSFWNDFGTALHGIASLLDSTEWLLRTELAYRRAVSEAPEDATCWFYLGNTLGQIFERTGNEDYFFQGKDCLDRSLELQPGQVEVWLRFGQLCLHHGKLHRDLQSIEESLEKFAQADACQGGHPLVQSRWGEALMLLGSFKENLQQLRGAEKKLSTATSHFPDNAEIWYTYAACLHELGRYFNDEEYYLQAVEKFQYGLSLDNGLPSLWHGLSQAHFALGEIHGDFLMVEQAAYYCSRAVELASSSAQYWNDWGVSLLKMGEITSLKQYILEAIEKFEQALHLRGGIQRTTEVDWLYHYGCALDFLGDYEANSHFYERSIAILQRVLELDPSYSHAKYNLALAYAHLGEVMGENEPFHKAIEYFRQLIEEDGEDDLVWNDWGLALLNLSELTREGAPGETHLREEAENKLLQAASLGCAQAYYNLACLYALMNCHQSAMFFLEKADANGGLPPLDDILQDEWLESLRQTDMFRHFINQIKNKSRI